MNTSSGITLPALPSGISDFEAIGSGHYLYVDKTELISQLADPYSVFRQPVVLTRPHGFGKTLLISALHSLFAHGLKFFQGLSIDGKWTDTTYPVMHLDFAVAASAGSLQETVDILIQAIKQSAAEAGLKPARIYVPRIYPGGYLNAILSQCPGRSVVLLIDNFDLPLLHALNDSRKFRDIDEVLQQILTVIKAQWGNIRFALIASITKFAEDYTFSGFNNARDISFSRDFSSLTGFTAQELASCLQPYIARAANSLNMPPAELTEQLQHYCGGYSFCFYEDTEMVCHPGAVLQFLQQNAVAQIRPSFDPIAFIPSALLRDFLQGKAALQRADGQTVQLPAEGIQLDAGLYGRDALTKKGIVRNFDSADLARLLLYLGLLTLQPSYDTDANVTIPNQAARDALQGRFSV